ncbi:type II toxin-antitoxin system VapC family toxin [Rhizobium rhizogenes]|uniref:Ribonuclease VapC n=1 Tax=Rhizobium rhizogenes NBRC 13257 TaxID=1220581 RepID=A0AA87QA98_RHIRH|nr:type II toxin-antitoxin system VapC family toxin [Rhizobium rhizogenes]NTG71322.1 type II toxin-antitoxin system VapC family toxin [Rhizobium rhizogenes]NTI72204.1 type II toxin-antitoxin system VapC family toxin [Rhizobium rhizogenes]TRB05152.1 type II toxin-antitoxin system VapC family toxin [Rhizobium rhizogenes]TRB39410.1 type II toxin-antitoxin system VapC family toxin [Rhizobium rhizogenes]TRB54686.1 type II toxin-antitoxin system VapC family toxin [Rhizobium rhizogenes]
MVIDTSAIVAILRNEPDAVRLEKALVSDPVRLVPATCVLEARMVLVSRRGEHALAEIDLWLTKIAADIIPIDADLVDMATRAWLTYGKGRHPAGLNFADCCSYALAKRADEALLFIGNDFSQTDIEAA